MAENNTIFFKLEEYYDNDMLLQALKDRFPLEYSDMYTEFDKLVF